MAYGSYRKTVSWTFHISLRQNDQGLAQLIVRASLSDFTNKNFLSCFNSADSNITQWKDLEL